MRRVIAVVAGAMSVFFIFYTIRLLVVTGFLQRLRAGGQGAYIGAVAFPAIAVLFGWAAWSLWNHHDGAIRDRET